MDRASAPSRGGPSDFRAAVLSPRWRPARWPPSAQGFVPPSNQHDRRLGADPRIRGCDQDPGEGGTYAERAKRVERMSAQRGQGIAPPCRIGRSLRSVELDPDPHTLARHIRDTGRTSRGLPVHGDLADDPRNGVTKHEESGCPSPFRSEIAAPRLPLSAPTQRGQESAPRSRPAYQTGETVALTTSPSTMSNVGES